MAYKAVIIGGSGLIGRSLVDYLLTSKEFTEVTSLARKKLPIHSSKLKQIIIDFDKLEDYAEHINGRAIFCCIGSTRKETPDLEEYHKIDHDYPVKMAEIGIKNGVKQYHFVSSLGADADSTNFYLQMKGETENDIEALPFKSVHIYRPSVLVGARTDSTRIERIGIKLMVAFNLFLWGSLKKYRAIEAKTVARAMFKRSLKRNQEGVFVYPSDEIKKLA
jgi:uncharacterized protein YbjT (DUF2867 family)